VQWEPRVLQQQWVIPAGRKVEEVKQDFQKTIRFQEQRKRGTGNGKSQMHQVTAPKAKCKHAQAGHNPGLQGIN